MIKVAHRYDYLSLAHPKVEFKGGDKLSRSRTLQSGKDEADINKIMERYEKTGLLGTPVDGGGVKPQFGDFSDVGDYHRVMTRLVALKSHFMKLSAKVRARFGNDPAQLLEFLADGKNDEEAVELGLKDRSSLDAGIAARNKAAMEAAAAAKAKAEADAQKPA